MWTEVSRKENREQISSGDSLHSLPSCSKTLEPVGLCHSNRKLEKMCEERYPNYSAIAISQTPTFGSRTIQIRIEHRSFRTEPCLLSSVFDQNLNLRSIGGV